MSKSLGANVSVFPILLAHAQEDTARRGNFAYLKGGIFYLKDIFFYFKDIFFYFKDILKYLKDIFDAFEDTVFSEILLSVFSKLDRFT